MTDPLRVCVNIPAVAERASQNPPISAPQPLCAYVNVALEWTDPVVAEFTKFCPEERMDEQMNEQTTNEWR